MKHKTVLVSLLALLAFCIDHSAAQGEKFISLDKTSDILHLVGTPKVETLPAIRSVPFAANTWNIKLVIAKRVDFTWTDASGLHRDSTVMTDADVAAIQNEFEQFKMLVDNLSGHRIQITGSVTIISDTAISDFTNYGTPSVPNFFPAPWNLANLDLPRFVPRGFFDSMILYWKGSSVPCNYWGGALGGDNGVNRAAYIAIQWLPGYATSHRNVNVHEWLHHFDWAMSYTLGYADSLIPDPDTAPQHSGHCSVIPEWTWNNSIPLNFESHIMQAHATGTMYEQATVIDPITVPFQRSWLLVGPFIQSNDETSFVSDFIGESSAEPAAGQVSGGKTWFTHNNSSDVVNLANIFSPHSYVYAYSFLYVQSPTTIPAKLWIGSDDGIRIWLNGTLVRSHHIHRDHDTDQEVIYLTLNPGSNRLLVKCEQITNGWGFSARFTDLQNNTLTGVLYSTAPAEPMSTLVYETFDGSTSIPSGWSVSPDSIAGYYTWGITSPYNPSSPPAPTAPNTATFQSYNLPAGSAARLITPALNWSAVSTPLCKFQFRRDTQHSNSLDSLYVDISTNGGSSWIELAGFRRPLTPPPFTSYFEEKTVNVAPYGGYSSVTFAFRGVSSWGNWIHIDNVFIGQEIVNDVGITAISTPISGNMFRTPQTFAVTVSNFGSAGQSAGAYNVRARVWRASEYPGGTPVFDQVESGPAVTGKSSASYIFANQWTPTEFGNYTIQVTTELIGDELPSNDASAPRSVAVVPIVDIAVTSIIYPTLSGLYTGTLGYSVKAAVKNNGVDTVYGSEYSAEARIGLTAGFPGSTTFHNYAIFRSDIPPGETREVNITASWVPADTGNHTVRFSVTLTADENGSNDTRDEQRVVNGPYYGGPDGGGYYYMTSLASGTNKPAFEWIDITSVGTPLTLADDGTSPPITIPSFQLYDSIRTLIRINANGFLTFDMDWNGSGSAGNKSMPNSIKPDGIIAAFWDDLNPAAPGAGSIYYYDDVTNHRLIVEYYNIPILGDTGKNTFEIILNYGENIYKANTILFQYLRTPGNESASTIGIENLSGTIGTQYLFDGTPSVRLDANFPDSLAILIGKDLSRNINPTVSLSIKEGWNLISVPVVVPDARKSVLFPTASSNAFTYQGSYVMKDTLQNQPGYWLKFTAVQDIPLNGTMRLQDSIRVIAGWNMIGSLSQPFRVSAITSSPPAIVSSSYFAFNGSYFQADSIKPGKGHWVKVKSDGKLFFSSGAASVLKQQTMAGSEIDKLNYLSFTDHSGNRQTLYFGTSMNKGINFELPPPPPQGLFDVRFSDGQLVSVFQTEDDLRDSRDIIIQPAEYPVIVEAGINQTDGAVYLLSDAVSGKILGEFGSNLNEKVFLDNKVSTRLRLANRISQTPFVPVEYALYQNHPNPFNPGTSIKFDMPVQGWVMLKVYDVLGREVQTLVDGERTAGRHEVSFDGENFSSGVYFYRLQTEQFTSIKKMLFSK